MLRPALSELLKPNQSYYMLVVAVAKRARQIAQKAEDEGIILTDKPVDMAVQDFVQGKYFIIEPEEDAGQEDE